MTYESLLKLAREGKTIYVKLKGFHVIHQVTGFSNMEYCVGGTFYNYTSDLYELLTGEPCVIGVAYRQPQQKAEAP